jgi:hypothetical protein
MLELKLPFVTSLYLNPNGMVKWAEGKTNTFYRTYRGLNSCGIDYLSHFCIRVFLRRLEVSHYDLDHLVEMFLIMIWISWWKTIVFLPKFLSHPLRRSRLRLFATHCVWPMCLNAS